MKYILLSVCILFAVQCYSQEHRPDTVVNGIKVAQYVEKIPAPEYDLMKYLSKNLHYPDRAREDNIEGRIIIRFIVTETGKITDAEVLKGIGGGCDEEGLRVVRNMPDWEPGMQNGKPVAAYFNLPLVFKLEGGRSRKKGQPRWKKVDD